MSETERFAMYCSEPPGCICQKCLFHASGRCPYGHCYDDLRAKINPYDKAHPDKPPRTLWSKWNEKGEQAHWCRGGIFYQSQKCPGYVEYDRSKHVVRECLDSMVSVFQDGYISCSLVESLGCEECMRRFNERIERKENEETMTTYFTKCGREFQKSTNAETTGYHLEEDGSGNIFDDKCAKCPFPVEVMEGYPGVHKRWECRAGSQPPNYETTWRGSLNDKNTLNIYSLDVALMTEIIEFAQDHPNLSAAYNADSQADCRRTVSVSCSQNKAGMAAKRGLIDNFFPVKKVEYPVDLFEPSGNESCANCGFDKENCQPYNYIISEGLAPEGCVCNDWTEENAQEATPDPTDDLGEGESICGDCQFYKSTGTDIGNCEEHHKPVSRFRPADDCDNWTPMAGSYEPVESPMEEEPKKKPRFHTGDECQQMREDCPCFCAHNDGCAVLLATGGALKAYVDRFTEDGGVDCDVFRKKAESVSKKPDPVIETAPSVIEQAGTVTAFDYSEVDEDTAHFLQDRATAITNVRIRSVIAIGRELLEAQGKLAKRGIEGCFSGWVESIGLKRSTAYDYIRAYEYVRNSDNQDGFETIQPSLLLEISKPSAPPELQQAVIDGDITKHKDYIKAMEELKEAKQNAEDWRKGYETQRNTRNELQKEVVNEKIESSKLLQDIKDLKQRLEQAERNSGTNKLTELGGIIKEKQEAIDDLKEKIRELNDQLNAKPVVIEAEVAETLPERPKARYCPIDGSLCHMVESNDQLTWDEIESLEPGEPLYLVSLEPHGNSGWILFNMIAPNSGSDGNRMSYRTSWGSGTLSSITHLTFRQGVHQFYRRKPDEQDLAN